MSDDIAQSMGFAAFGTVSKPKREPRNNQPSASHAPGSNLAQVQNELQQQQNAGRGGGSGGGGGRGGRGGGRGGGGRGRGGRAGGGGHQDGGGNKRQRTDGGPALNGGGHGQSFAHQQEGYIRDSFFEDPWAKLFAARAGKA